MAAGLLSAWHLIAYGTAALRGAPATVQAQTQLEVESTAPRWFIAPTPARRALVLAALFFLTETIAFFVDFSGRGFREAAVLFALGLLTTGIVFVVALRTRAFFWVAGTAFLSAGVFVASLAYARTRDALQVRPAAVIREGDTVTGFFIAETSSQIYLGRNALGERENPRILVLPKDEISDLAIGPLSSPPMP